MSEGPQRSSSRATLRAERTTTSCGECRRRKQKCDQRLPCGNCARRFPQPPCEYRSSVRTPTPTPKSTTPAAAPAFDAAAHLDKFLEHPIPGTYGALLDAPQPPWAKRSGGEVVRWSGVDLTTTYPNTHPGSDVPWPTGGEGQPLHGTDDSSDQGICRNNCKLHSAAIHDALKLLVHHYSIPDKFLGEQSGGLWNPSDIKELLAWNVRPATGIPWPVGGSLSDLRHLPMAPTRPNGELLRICQQQPQAPFPILSVADLLRTDLKLLCRFKASLDGNPDPNNPFIKHHVPYCVQDPMLLQIILYTSACFLNETGHIPRTVMMAHKGEAIRMLNEHLRSDVRQTSDAAIAGVVQLIVDEWYWGETQDLKAHLRGLREMVRLRGGFSQLGMGGFLAKNAICHDMAIALAHETQPYLQDGPDFRFEDAVGVVPFKISHNTPFVRDLPSFADCGRSLGLHPATATILDDMRFLFNVVLTLPADPTPQQQKKVQTTCQWVHNRLQALNPVFPGSRQPSPRASLSRSADEEDVHMGGLEGPGLSTGSNTRLHPAMTRAAGGGPSEREAADDQRPSSSSRRASMATLMPLAPQRTPSPSATSEQASRHRDPQADPLYQVVRRAALVYSRAIMTRAPIRATCTQSEFLEIWTTMWRVPLATWKAANGVFCWAMLAIAPCCHETAHARFVKSMLIISVLGLGMENWAVAVEAARAGLMVQQWLSQGAGAGPASSLGGTPSAAAAAMPGEDGGIRLEAESEGNEGVIRGVSGSGPADDGRGDKGGLGGGGDAVDKHGYHQPGW